MATQNLYLQAQQSAVHDGRISSGAYRSQKSLPAARAIEARWYSSLQQQLLMQCLLSIPLHAKHLCRALIWSARHDNTCALPCG